MFFFCFSVAAPSREVCCDDGTIYRQCSSFSSYYSWQQYVRCELVVFVNVFVGIANVMYTCLVISSKNLLIVL